jgi:hypothetical protein
LVEEAALVELGDFDKPPPPAPKGGSPPAPAPKSGSLSAPKGGSPPAPKGGSPPAPKGGSRPSPVPKGGSPPPKGAASKDGTPSTPRDKNRQCRKRGQGGKGGKIQRRGVATSYDIRRECSNFYLHGAMFGGDCHFINAKGDKRLHPGTKEIEQLSASINLDKCVSSQYRKLFVKHLSQQNEKRVTNLWIRLDVGVTIPNIVKIVR